MRVELANPRGFCAGVERAIDIVERALAKHGAPVYVRHEVVHNRFVVAELGRKGAVFVDELAAVPAGAMVVFSAHGVSQAVRAEARRRDLTVFDATCPLVTKVHNEVRQYRKRGLEVILIGHAGHPEVEGTLGQSAAGIYLLENLSGVEQLRVACPEKLAYVSQTTLSVDDTAAIIAALRARFPRIRGPRKDDICYATQNRQDAVKKLAQTCDAVLVVGSPNSSNSNRLREIAERCGADAYLIDGPADIPAHLLAAAMRVGITAGASAPEELVAAVARRLGGAAVEMPAAREGVAFALPRELRDAAGKN